MQLKYRWTAKNKLTNISKDSNYWWLTLQSGFNLQLTKDRTVKVTVFPVVTYGCASRTIKKVERWRIDALELWCWRRLLRVPWTARKSNQSILKEINPEYTLKELMLKLNSNTLATWCEESTHWKRPLRWEKLKAEGEEGGRGWDCWIASPIQWTWTWANSRC